jgi:hypothetical protein
MIEAARALIVIDLKKAMLANPEPRPSPVKRRAATLRPSALPGEGLRIAKDSADLQATPRALP